MKNQDEYNRRNQAAERLPDCYTSYLPEEK